MKNRMKEKRGNIFHSSTHVKGGCVSFRLIMFLSQVTIVVFNFDVVNFEYRV